MARYRESHGTADATNDLPEALRAAADGRLKALFVAVGVQRRAGRRNPAARDALRVAEAGDEELLNVASRDRCYRRDGLRTASGAQFLDVELVDPLDRLRERSFAAMVLDLMMPIMSGIEVIRYLETHDDAGAPCVIVVTAASQRELQQVQAASVHAVLRKPFDLSALIAVVRDYGRQHRG